MNTIKRKQIFNSSGTSNARVCVPVFSVFGLDSQVTPFHMHFQSCKYEAGGLYPSTCGHHKTQHNQKLDLENS